MIHRGSGDNYSLDNLSQSCLLKGGKEEEFFMKEIENMANTNKNGKDFERLEASDLD